MPKKKCMVALVVHGELLTFPGWHLPDLAGLWVTQGPTKKSWLLVATGVNAFVDVFPTAKDALACAAEVGPMLDWTNPELRKDPMIAPAMGRVFEMSLAAYRGRKEKRPSKAAA